MRRPYKNWAHFLEKKYFKNQILKKISLIKFVALPSMYNITYRKQNSERFKLLTLKIYFEIQNFANCKPYRD